MRSPKKRTLGQMINKKIRDIKRAERIMARRKSYGIAHILSGAVYGLESFKSDLTKADLKLNLNQQSSIGPEPHWVQGKKGGETECRQAE